MSWFVVKRLVECLLIKEAMNPFIDCTTAQEVGMILMSLSKLEMIGLIAVIFVVGSAIIEIGEIMALGVKKMIKKRDL